MNEYREALESRIFWIIKGTPGMVRTEIRDGLGMPNNVVTPCIKKLIDNNMVVEGAARISKTTNKPGKSLYVAEDWAREVDSQNRIFE